MTFEDFIAPLSADVFLRNHLDRAPVHLPAPPGATRGELIDWTALSTLLSIRSHWTDQTIKLVMNSRPVDPGLYMRDDALAGRRLADPGVVNAFLDMGASLVADAAEAVSPAIRQVCDMLGRRFATAAGANIYCSFGGIQAFASHYDTHDVFALQCSGEKTWRLYANRADNPLDAPHGGAEVQAEIDRTKGPLAAEIVMRPGDLLYLPRGVYHDALASSAASLHVTFAMMPAHGALIFDLLAQTGRQQSEFRAYLPSADDGDRLEARLDILADHVAGIMRSGAFRDAIALRQRTHARPAGAVTLPGRAPLDFFRPTGRGVRIERVDTGVTLVSERSRMGVGRIEDAVTWALQQPALCVQILTSRFAHHPEHELRALVAWLERDGIVARFTPDH